MPARVTRAVLQAVYLERATPPASSSLREVFGLRDARGGAEQITKRRKTLDLHGRMALVDEPLLDQGTLRIGAELELALTIGANTSNLAHASLSLATVLLLNVTGAYALHGIDSWCDEPEKLVVNVGAGTLTLPNESASAYVDNRFALPNAASVALGPGGAAWIVRDREATRWRAQVIAAGDIAGGGGMLDFSLNSGANTGWIPAAV